MNKAVGVLAGMVMMTLIIIGSGWNAKDAGKDERPAPVLQPKDSLMAEQGRWTFAPDVPPPIQRKEQRRVRVQWSISETQAEIAQGVIYDDYWGFEGKVPGPLLRVREGDLIEIELTNKLASKRPHNIDFHFVSGPGGGAHALDVAPGETAKLEARAMAPGLYMFHCATPDIPTHIANGMYGFVLVEPAEGMSKVDKEFYIVQSEIYTKNGDPGHQSYSPERGDRADAQYIVFNGAVGSTLNERALRSKVGESVRMYVGNAGPNLISSFHVIGQIFDKVYREGDLLSDPGKSIQTTLIPAGGSSIVEFTPLVPGKFVFVDHAIFRLHQGAVGALAVTGAENAEIFAPLGVGKKEETHDAHVIGIPPAIGRPTGEQPELPKATVVADNAAAAGPTLVADGNNVIIKMMPGASNPDDDPNNDYSVKKLTIKAGTTVTWVNTERAMHNVLDEEGTFISPEMMPNQTFAKKFDKPGVHHFYCKPHPWMKGTLVVQ